MTIDLNTISNVLNRARRQLKGGPAPFYYNHEQKKAWLDGFNYCIETFVQAALQVTRELAAEQQSKEDREAVADPFYDWIDHLLWKAYEHQVTPDERAELHEDHKRLRALEKSHRRAKVDPKQQIVVFHGQHTGKLARITQQEQEVNREAEQ